MSDKKWLFNKKKQKKWCKKYMICFNVEKKVKSIKFLVHTIEINSIRFGVLN